MKIVDVIVCSFYGGELVGDDVVCERFVDLFVCVVVGGDGGVFFVFGFGENGVWFVGGDGSFDVDLVVMDGVGYVVVFVGVVF